jgi:hypothetical protein
MIFSVHAEVLEAFLIFFQQPASAVFTSGASWNNPGGSFLISFSDVSSVNHGRVFTTGGREKTTFGCVAVWVEVHPLEILPFTQHLTFIEPHALSAARRLRRENRRLPKTKIG